MTHVLDTDINALLVFKQFEEALSLKGWSCHMEYDPARKGWVCGAWADNDKENKYVGLMFNQAMMSTQRFYDELPIALKHLRNQAIDLDSGRRWVNE